MINLFKVKLEPLRNSEAATGDILSKKLFLKCLWYLQEKTVVEIFLIKLQTFKETPMQMFSCEIWKIFKNIFLKEHLWRLLLLPKQVKQTKIQILHEYFCWNTISAVTLEKLCYNKPRLNKAPCFNKSIFGELKENTWFFCLKYVVINL